MSIIYCMSNFFFQDSPSPFAFALRRYPAIFCNTVKSSNFVRGPKFRHPSSEFLWSPGKFISSDIKNFRKQTHLKIILSFDVIVGQKEVNMAFFEDLCFFRFWDEINFKNLKKSPRKHQDGGILEDSYSHEKFI
jgi:hypothetical protein